MNPKSNSRWQVKLGILQVLVLLGVVTGSMLGAFGIGYVSGNSAGFESAQDSNVVTLARFPVDRDEADEQYVSEVYAKLNDKKPTPKKKELKRKDPKPIEEAPENVPVLDEGVADDVLDELTEIGDEPSEGAKELAREIKSTIDSEAGPTMESKQGSHEGLDVALVGSERNGANKTTTLGMLLEERKREREEMQKNNVEAEVDQTVEKDESKKPQAKTTASEATLAKSQAEVPEEPKVSDEEAAPTKLADVRPQEEEEVEPKKEEEAPVAPTVQNKIKSGWYAQVLAPKDLQEAESLSTRLKESGFPVVIEQAEVRGQQYYRVLVGGEETRKQAEILIQQLQREKYLRGDPFLRLLR